MQTKSNRIDVDLIPDDELEYEPRIDVDLIPDDELEFDIPEMPDTQYQGGGQAQAQEPEPELDPDDIWNDASFTGEKPIDEGPSMWQKIVPGLATGMGGPFIEPMLYAATGTEPYRAPDADPNAFEPRKGMTEGWKSTAKGVSRALQLITSTEADLPDAGQYDLEDPIARSNYYLELLQSKAFNETNEIVAPIFTKLTELEQLQPDMDYYERLEKKSGFTKYAEEVVGMAPQMATQLAAHAIGGPVTSGIWMALQIAGAEYDALIRDGADPERAEAAAWGSALMQAPMEALSLGFMLNNPITRKFVKGGIVKFGLDRVIGAATEWITETVQSVPSKFWENWAQDPEYLNKLRDNPEMLKALIVEGLAEGMKEGNVAAFYGAIFGGSGAAKPKPRIKTQPDLSEGTQQILDTLADEFKAGTRTVDDIEFVRKGIDPSSPLYDALGKLIEEPAAGEQKPTDLGGPKSGERLDRLESIVIGTLKAQGNYEEGETLEAVQVVESKKKRVNRAVKILKAIGLDVIVYQGKGKIDGFNGMMDTDTGQIYLNESAKDPYVTVLGHESTHRLKKDHPDLYNKLEDAIKSMDIDITDYLVQTNKNRKAAGVSEILLEDALSTEEFIADLVGYQFGEKAFWNKLDKANPTLGKQLAKIVSELLDAIKSAMRQKKSIDAQIFRDLNNMQDAIAGVYGEFARREAKVKPVEKKLTAEEKAARAADMPLQVEFDHIVKSLKGDKRAAAAEVIADTEAPIRERLAKLKAILAPAPAKPAAPEDRRKKLRPGEAERREEELPSREPPAWDKEFRAIYTNAKKLDEAKFIESGKKLLAKRPTGLMDLAKRMGVTIEADTDIDEALKTIHARIMAGMQPRKKASEMTEEELREASNTDYLTGLRNKQAFDLEDTRRAHVASIDLDSLKYINDNFGHQAGDAMLINFGNALKTITEADTYHVSGDEFIVQSDDAAQLEELLNKRVIDYLNKNPLTVITPDGKTIKYEVQFSHGTAKTVAKAEEALHVHKEAREATGKRAGRGEIPPGISKGLAEGQRPEDQRKAVSGKVEVTPEQEYEGLVSGLTPEQRKDKAVKNVIEDKTGAVSQRLGTLKNAIAAYDKKHPEPEPKVKKAKESKRGLNVRTLRGAILAAGGIKWGDQFKGERKEMPQGSRMLTRQKSGMSWDTLEQQLKDDGWLGADEVLLDILNDESVLKRSRVTGDILEKEIGHLTTQEKEAKAEIVHEAEEPPPGDYQVMAAEDLPEGKKLTLIESESTRGWDVYEVIEKDPFGVTLKDGITIELSPTDKVQVKKTDLAASVKKGDKAKAEFSVKSYGDMDKGDKAAYNKQTKVMRNGDEVRKRINKNKGSAWAGTAIRSILTRQSFDDIIAGKPVTYDSPVNEKKAAAFKARLEKGGESAMWDYLMKRSFLGDAKKPIHCISGSFAECNPSKNCVDVCYAATGRRNPSVFLKAESVNWGIEKNPKRAASMAAIQYQAVMDAEVHKALRMFDRGEAGSENWTTFINELNGNGIRTQVFSKRPEFIRSISDMNLKMLSVDSSNTALADANPDLALAIIYEGDHDLDMLEKYKDRLETQGGVILPIIYTRQSGKQKLKPEGWTDADIAQLPAWAKNYTCPIDAGIKRIQSEKAISEEEAKKPIWNCTKCDSMNGLPGCFYGKSTAKVLAKLPERLTTDEIQYRVEYLKTYGKGIKDARDRKQFYEDLDLLISEVRGGRDPGAAGTIGSEISGLREREPGEIRGRRRTGKGVKDKAKLSVKSVKPWPEGFPNATVHTNLPKLTGHEQYKAAKTGSAEAAIAVATDLVNVAKAKKLGIDHPDAILLPVLQREEGGNNFLPLGLAKVISKYSGLPVELEAVEIHKVGRTAKTALTKLTARPIFEGEIKANQEYILVDDALAQGGTISELRHHIENAGGKVVNISAFGAAQYSTVIAPNAGTIQKLKEKFGHDETEQFLKDYNIAGTIEALTEREASYLLKFGSLDAIRARAVKEGIPGIGQTFQRRLWDKGTIADEDIEISDSAKVRFSPKFKKPGQMELPIFSQQQFEIDFGEKAIKVEAEKPKPKPKAPKMAKMPPPKVQRGPTGVQGSTQKTRMATTGFIGSNGKVVRDSDEAASLLAPIRKGAQEELYTVAVDKTGLVLELQRYTKGVTSSAPVDAAKLMGHMLRIKGAAKYYFIHNHPSTDPTPSPDDQQIVGYQKQISAIKDMEVHGLVIGGTSYLDMETGDIHPIKAISRTMKLPVKERALVKLADYGKLPEVSNSAKALDYLAKVHKGAEGFLLLDAKLKPTGFLTLDPPTTMKAMTAKLLAAVEDTNATGYLFNSIKPVNTTPGRVAFLNGLTDQMGNVLQLIEVIDQGVSMADTGQLNQYKKAETGVKSEMGLLGTDQALMSVKSPGFYSQMEKTLEEKLQGKGTPAQFKQTIGALAKKGEFKPEELEWSGLEQWLALKDTDAKMFPNRAKIKKSDVMKWIRTNALQIEETHYRHKPSAKEYIDWPQDTGDEYSATWINPVDGKKHKLEIKKVAGPVWDVYVDNEVVSSELSEENAKAAASDLADDLFENTLTKESKLTWSEKEGAMVPTWEARGEDPVTGESVKWEIQKFGGGLPHRGMYEIYQDGELWDDTIGSLPEAQRFVSQQIEDTIRDSINEEVGGDYLPGEGEPLHETWTMPGGENYQELLLRMPPDITEEHKARDKRLKELIAERDKKKEDLAQEVDVSNTGMVENEKRQIRNLETQIDMVMTERDQEGKRTGFVHPHWPEANVVAHARFNDRTDDKGRRVLFLEEVQSDWHQEGRKKGYSGKPPGYKKLDNGKYQLIFPDGTKGAIYDNKTGAQSAIEYLSSQGVIGGIKSGVLDAPFKKSWPLLVIKRMVRWAAKEGYDTISWTPGIVQVNRYEEAFRKQVDKISWYISPSKNIKVVNAYKDGHQVGVFELDEKGIATQAFPEDAAGEHINDIIGKRLGNRAMAEKKAIVTGEDLTIGGEGMKQAYDVRLVNDVNNFFDKEAWGNPHVEIAGTVTSTQIGEEITLDIFTRAVEEAENAKDPVAAKWLTEQANIFMNTGKYSMALWNPNPWPGADKPPSYYFDKARKFEDKYERIWTLPITTEMREKSLEEGMPLFSVKKALKIPDMTDPSVKDYRVKMSIKEEDHPGHEAAKLFNGSHGDHIVTFDGEWDRSAVDMDPLYQFTLHEGPAIGATFVSETLDPEDIEKKFIQIVTPFLENKAALSAKDRIDPVLQSYIKILKAAQPDAFLSSEDLTEDPDDELPKEVAATLEFSKGLGRLSMGERLKETLKDIWHSSTRHRPYLDPKEYADIANVLRIHQEVPTNSSRRAAQVLSGITGNLKPMQYKVFARKLLMDDMAKDVESGLLADPDNLPFGFNIKTARAYLAKLDAIVAKDKIIQEAIQNRTDANNELKQALVDAKLLPKAVMEDDRYFHHQVLQYRAVKELGEDYYPGIGVSSKDVRLKKKGWQRGRIGSNKDYNSDYAESEFEVIAQALAQLETKSTMGRLQGLADIMPGLKTRAKSMNLQQLYINAAEQATKADKSGKIWTPVMIQTEPGMNPLRPFSAEIGKGFSWIGNLAKKGKLQNGTRDFTDVIEALEEWQRDVADEKARAKDDGRDPYPIPFPFDELGSRAWAYFNHMMAENLEGAPAAGIIFRAIRQRDAFIKEYLGTQFKTARDIMPDDHTIWKPAPGTSWYKAYSLSDRIVDAVQAGEMVIGEENADKIKQILARGRDIEWIIPTDVAKTLDGYDVKLEDHMLSIASRKLMTGWKQWILINPYRVVKYNLNNMSGDLDIALAYDPKIVFKYFAKATKDMYKDWKNKKIPDELQAELDLAHSQGVVGSGWSVQEIGDVTREFAYDKHMQAVTGEKPALIKRGWRSLQGFTNYRENILRLAAFRYFQDRLAAGEKNIYGASNKAEIDGIADNTEKAAKLARELIGDYGNITHSGQWLRRHLIPFYSWMEVNAPRYVRLMRNLRHEGQGAKKIGRALPLLSAKMGWRGTKLAMKSTAIYTLVNLWNRAFFPDEEDELGEAQRRQLHIIFGRRDDGSIISLRFQGALSDALAWFGGEDITHDIADVVKGKVSIGKKAKETALAPVIKVISGIRPDVKSGAELLSGMSYWPDPFNPRPIYDKLEHVTRLFSLNGAYGWLTGKPKRGDTTGERLLNDLMALGFYNSDPGEQAYYDIKSKTFDYLEKTSGERRRIIPNNVDKARYYYKQALKYGDLKAAEKYLAKFIKLGGKTTGVTSSLKRSAPLGSLPKKDHNKFLATLNETEKERYRLALRWYNDTYKRRRRQASIRPAPSGLDGLEVDKSQPGKNTLRDFLNQKNE